MHVVARTSRQPAPHFLVLVGGVVINHQMDVQFRRHIGLDVFEELQKFLMTVARLTPGQYLSRGKIQGGEQSGGAVADIVMSHPLHIAQPHGQHRLGAVQGLNLALLIDAQDQGLIGRIEI